MSAPTEDLPAIDPADAASAETARNGPEAHHSPLTTHHSPNSDSSPLTTHHSPNSDLPTSSASLPTADCRLPTAFCPLPPASAPLTRTFIRPATGWQLVNVAELWQYRELLYFLTWRDVKVRYKQTVLGAAWAVLQPAMMMVVFSIFFGRMAHVNSGGIPYPLFVFAGLLPWTFFATAIANAGNSVVGSERLITKVYFPRLAIPFASVGAALVDFAVAFSMLVVLMVWYQVPPSWSLLMIFPLVALFTLAALGVGTLLAALNVAYRDFRYVIPFLVQLWMFATPTIYMQPEEFSGQGAVGSRQEGASGQKTGGGGQEGTSGQVAVSSGQSEAADGRQAHHSPLTTHPSPASSPTTHHSPGSAPLTTHHSPASADQGAVPDSIQHLLNLNPMTGLVAFFRSAVLGRPLPWGMVGWSTGGVLIAFVVGCLYFRKVEDSFADII